MNKKQERKLNKMINKLIKQVIALDQKYNGKKKGV